MTALQVWQAIVTVIIIVLCLAGYLGYAMNKKKK